MSANISSVQLYIRSEKNGYNLPVKKVAVELEPFLPGKTWVNNGIYRDVPNVSFKHLFEDCGSLPLKLTTAQFAARTLNVPGNPKTTFRYEFFWTVGSGTSEIDDEAVRTIDEFLGGTSFFVFGVWLRPNGVRAISARVATYREVHSAQESKIVITNEIGVVIS